MRVVCSGILRRYFFGLIVLSVLEAGGASAESYHVAPAPMDSDANDCSPQLPCATFQHAVDLCRPERLCVIAAAAGIYSQRINVTHFKLVSLEGRQAGGCKNRSAVVIDNRNDDAGTTRPIVWVQDHATLMLKCVTLASYREGAGGFAARQFAIGDVIDVDFLGFPGGVDVSATETSKINILNAGVRGSASRFASASALSQITFGGTSEVADGLTFDVAFLSSLFGSVVTVVPASIAGGDRVKGPSYQCSDAIIVKSVVLPGGDTPYPDNEGCLMSGEAAAPHPVARLRAELIEKSERRFEAIEGKLEPLVAELGRQESSRSRQQRQHNRIDDILIGAIALLSLANMGLVWWWLRRGRAATRRQAGAPPALRGSAG